MNQPPIQFPLHPESPIQNVYNNIDSSHVGNKGNKIDVGMDDFLWDIVSMEGMLLDVIQQDELGDDADITNTFTKSWNVCIHHPSLWSWMIKVYTTRDNNVTIQLESNVQYVRLTLYFQDFCHTMDIENGRF